MPKINATSLGRKTNATFKNFVNLTEFFKMKHFFVKYETVWRNFHNFFVEILQKVRKTKHTNHFDNLPKMCLFSKLCRNTIARSFLGMHWNCLSLGSHSFIPRGFAPWDETMTPLGLAISMHPSKWSCNNIVS